MSKLAIRLSSIAWAAAAAAAGWSVGLERVLPATFGAGGRSTGGGDPGEFALATAVALLLAPLLLPPLLARRDRTPPPGAPTQAPLAAAAVAWWVFAAGQVWVKNHPLVDRARSIEGLGLELSVLVRAAGLGACVGVLVYFLVVRVRIGRLLRPRALLVVLLLLALLGAWTLHGRTTTSQARALATYREATPRADYNVLLVTLDTQRADYLGCYGAEVSTPHIDALARAGAQFDRAYSTTNVTMPSHATILTARWMKEHGMESNFSPPLSASNLTLPEILHEIGYATGAFTSLFILDGGYSGLMQGVDTWWAPERGFTASEEAFTRAAVWLESVADRRFFAWVHSYDVHRPYEPVPPYDTLYYQDVPDDPDNLSFTRIPSFHPRPFGVTDIDYLPAMYKGETSYQDEQLGVLFARMKELGIFDNTLIVLTADHGESLGEHDLFYSHDALYEEDVRVPLILHAPDLVPAGLRSGALVQTIDLVPTVLELLGLPPLELASGTSLAPLLSDPAAQVRSHAFLEGKSYRALGIVDSTWAFIHPLKDMVPNHNVELFRIADDPQQLRNLFYSERPVAERYLDLAQEFSGRRIRLGKAAKSGVRPTVSQQLNALGYVQ